MDHIREPAEAYTVQCQCKWCMEAVRTSHFAREVMSMTSNLVPRVSPKEQEEERPWERGCIFLVFHFSHVSLTQVEPVTFYIWVGCCNH